MDAQQVAPMLRAKIAEAKARRAHEAAVGRAVLAFSRRRRFLALRGAAALAAHRYRGVRLRREYEVRAAARRARLEAEARAAEEARLAAEARAAEAARVAAEARAAEEKERERRRQAQARLDAEVATARGAAERGAARRLRVAPRRWAWRGGGKELVEALVPLEGGSCGLDVGQWGTAVVVTGAREGGPVRRGDVVVAVAGAAGATVPELLRRRSRSAL